MLCVRFAFVYAFLLASLSAQALPPASLSLSINDSASGTAYAGWPLRLRATVALSADATTYVLSPALLSVTIYGRDAAALDLPFNRTSGPSQDATLDEVNDTAAFTLYLSPDQTADLAGNYVVKFSLGELLISKPVTFSDESTAAPEGFATLKRFAWCDYQLATADFQSALDLATQELSSNPASLPAMSRAAAAMQGLGDTAGALKMLAQAMDAFKQQYPDALHPPADFHRRYSALLSTLAPESVQ